MSFHLLIKTIFHVQFRKILKEDRDQEIVWRRLMKFLQILELVSLIQELGLHKFYKKVLNHV